jgi:aldehyde dehydrogenase (NAD+)
VSIWSQNISLVIANNLQVGTVWVNSFSIEKGIETRKFSGNYLTSGSQSLLNFMKPKWQTKFTVENNITIEKLEKDIKSFGGLSSSSALPLSDTVNSLKTYKIYVGGKQARPDTQASKSVYIGHDDKTKKIACLVADCSRKDVRNAVEAAVAASNE